MEELKKTQATTEKVKAQVNHAEVTFDFEGVAKHLKNENQIRVFRELCLRKGIQEFLPVKQQAALAAKLAAFAEEWDTELSGDFMRAHIVGVLRGVKNTARTFTDEQIREMERSDAQFRFGNLQHHFSRNIAGARGDCEQMLKLMEKHRDIRFVITPEFRRALQTAAIICEKLKGRV
jgi:hypothetical protein